MIELKDVHKSFLDGSKQHAVLRGLTLSLSQGQSLALTGESGSGKSTLLHILAGLDQADNGSVLVNNQDLRLFNEKQSDDFRKTAVGIVFQRFNLIDCLSGWDNVCLPARLIDQYHEDYLHMLLDKLGVGALKDNLPINLSGGEQQRFAIARALAHKPKVLLADEPTGNLDDKTSEKVSQLLFGLCRDLDTSLVIVTHSAKLASQAQHHYHLLDGKLVNAK